MLESISKFIRDLTDPTSQISFAPDDPRVAVAGLLFHAVAIDGRVTTSEQSALIGGLGRLFGLDARATQHLADAGAEEARNSVDTSEALHSLRRSLGATERLAILETVWEVACADGTLHEFEEDLIWRIAEPLGISDADRDALRAKIATSSALGGRG